MSNHYFDRKIALRKVQNVIREADRYINTLDGDGVLSLTLGALASAVANKTSEDVLAVRSLLSFYVHSRPDLMMTKGLNGGIRRAK